MRKRKLVIVITLVSLLVTSCASSSPYGKKHRKKRKCNCPTFSFYYPNQDESTLHITSA